MLQLAYTRVGSLWALGSVCALSILITSNIAAATEPSEPYVILDSYKLINAAHTHCIAGAVVTPGGVGSSYYDRVLCYLPSREIEEVEPGYLLRAQKRAIMATRAIASDKRLDEALADSPQLIEHDERTLEFVFARYYGLPLEEQGGADAQLQGGGFFAGSSSGNTTLGGDYTISGPGSRLGQLIEFASDLMEKARVAGGKSQLAVFRFFKDEEFVERCMDWEDYLDDLADDADDWVVAVKYQSTKGKKNKHKFFGPSVKDLDAECRQFMRESIHGQRLPGRRD